MGEAGERHISNGEVGRDGRRTELDSYQSSVRYEFGRVFRVVVNPESKGRNEGTLDGCELESSEWLQRGLTALAGSVVAVADDERAMCLRLTRLARDLSDSTLVRRSSWLRLSG